MRHLVIGQRQQAPNFSAFHWSQHSCLITIGQHSVTTRVVHLPKRTETSLITESDQSRANRQLLQQCTVRTAWSDSDQAVRAVHSCKSWFKHMTDIDGMGQKHKNYLKTHMFKQQLRHLEPLIFDLSEMEINSFRLVSLYLSVRVHHYKSQ